MRWPEPTSHHITGQTTLVPTTINQRSLRIGYSPNPLGPGFPSITSPRTAQDTVCDPDRSRGPKPSSIAVSVPFADPLDLKADLFLPVSHAPDVTT